MLTDILLDSCSVLKRMYIHVEILENSLLCAVYNKMNCELLWKMDKKILQDSIVDIVRMEYIGIISDKI